MDEAGEAILEDLNLHPIPVRVVNAGTPDLDHTSFNSVLAVVGTPENIIKQNPAQYPEGMRVTIDIAGGNDIWVGESQQKVAQGLGFRHRAALTTPLIFHTREDVWVAVATGSTALVSWMAEWRTRKAKGNGNS